jgi:hypothetical protein
MVQQSILFSVQGGSSLPTLFLVFRLLLWPLALSPSPSPSPSLCSWAVHNASVITTAQVSHEALSPYKETGDEEVIAHERGSLLLGEFH